MPTKYRGYGMSENEAMGLNEIKLRLREFAKARDWDQFHSPKNLSMALSVEVAEILEYFQWLTEEESNNLPQNKLDEVKTELADTLIYLIRLADKLDIDLLVAAKNKIENNKQKYPVDKAKGNAKKYTEFDK
jgi:NTP pyrophosphatase (non-canonical NTP hydrolase)